MSAQQFQMEDPVNVIDEIPEPHRATFIAVLQDKDPDLLRALRVSTLPTLAEWETVEESFIDALSDHYGPGHEPDETGKRIDNELGAFMTRWPNDNLTDSGPSPESSVRPTPSPACAGTAKHAQGMNVCEGTTRRARDDWPVAVSAVSSTGPTPRAQGRPCSSAL